MIQPDAQGFPRARLERDQESDVKISVASVGEEIVLTLRTPGTGEVFGVRLEAWTARAVGFRMVRKALVIDRESEARRRKGARP